MSALRKCSIIAAVVTVLCVPIGAWYITGLARAAELRGRLVECRALVLRGGGVEYRLDEGDAAFAPVLEEARQALARGPTFRLTSKTSGTLLFYDGAGEVIASAELYFPYVLLIGNYMFPFDERWAIWHFRETWRKRTYEYPSGKRKADGRHDSGKKHGHWTYYYESGASRSGGSYDRGKKVGKWTYWDEEGKVTSERWYLDDREVSAREYRDSVPQPEQ